MLVTDKTPVPRGVFIGQPNATTIQSSHISLLPIPHLSLAARHIHTLSAMKYQFIMSVGQLCDNGFSINFDENHVHLRKGKLLHIGTIDPTSDLYYIDFDAPNHPPHFMNPIDITLSPLAPTSEARAYSAHHMTTESDLVQYLHQAACSPVPSIWIKAI